MKASDLPVFVLCGGYGTRLREETEFRPKPMIKIGERPILWHLMRIYAHFGCREFSLCLGYKAEVIRDYFLNYRSYAGSSKVSLRTGRVDRLGDSEAIEDWEVNLIDTGLDSMTGLRVKRALKVCPADTFFLTYGDGVADIDVDRLLDFHVQSGRKVTITAVHPSSRFGEIDIEGDVARGFYEKPQTTAGWINGGFMVVQREALDELSEGSNEALETSILEPLSARGELAVYRHHGFWQCMDTFRESELLNNQWNQGQAKWKVWKD